MRIKSKLLQQDAVVSFKMTSEHKTSIINKIMSCLNFEAIQYISNDRFRTPGIRPRDSDPSYLLHRDRLGTSNIYHEYADHFQRQYMLKNISVRRTDIHIKHGGFCYFLGQR